MKKKEYFAYVYLTLAQKIQLQQNSLNMYWKQMLHFTSQVMQTFILTYVPLVLH